VKQPRHGEADPATGQIADSLCIAAPEKCYNRIDSQRRNFRGTYYCFP